MKADLWGTAKFVDSVRLPYIAPSLGGIESLIEQPTVISYWDQVRHFAILPDRAHGDSHLVVIIIMACAAAVTWYAEHSPAALASARA